MRSKLLGILGSSIASVISLVVINLFVHGFNEHLFGTAVLGGIWGLLIGAAIAACCPDRPLLTGSISATVMYGIIGVIIITGIQPVLYLPGIVLAVFTTIGIGAFAGLGYRFLSSRAHPQQ